MIQAVVFDLDGVLVDSEHVWDAAREELARERGGRWHDGAQRDMMGMSSTEWSRYMHETIGIPDPPEEISAEVVRRLEQIYRRHLPLIDGAAEAVERLAARWPLAVASSSNRPIIDLVLELSDLARFFSTTVSSEEVPRGKPAPDVYLEAAKPARSRPGRLRRGRGLAQRHPERKGRWDEGDRHPEPALSAGRGRPDGGGRRARFDPRADARDRGRA